MTLHRIQSPNIRDLRPKPSAIITGMRSRSPAIPAALLALAAVGAAAVARRRLARFEVVEQSMEPALYPGDYLIAVRTDCIGPGDVVIYRDPSNPDRDLIKRAVAVDGATVDIAGGKVLVDGTELSEPWAIGPTLPDASWSLPPNSFFPLGDNRPLSAADGRSCGPVERAGVHKAVWRYWPLRSFGPV